MGLVEKIQKRVHIFYRQQIVCEQYPMLTSLSRKEWENKNAWGLVYMLHHISEKDSNRIPTNEDLKVSPVFLEHIIMKYKKAGFQFLSLDELSNIINLGRKPDKPFVSFTIDDGYNDNYSQALPIFEKYQVPFALFIATDFINQKSILWWDIIEDIVLQNDTIYFCDKTFSCRSFQEKWDTYRILREAILKYDHSNLFSHLQEAFSHYAIDWYAPVKKQALSWEQVKYLSSHPLCTIGGHTVSHPALNKLNKSDFHHEVARGIAILEEKTGKNICHFAYPYGSANEIGDREQLLIKEFNFKTVFSSYGGCITSDNKSRTNHLPRVTLHEYQ